MKSRSLILKALNSSSKPSKPSSPSTLPNPVQPKYPEADLIKRFIKRAKEQSAQVLQVVQAEDALPLIRSQWQQIGINKNDNAIYLSPLSSLAKLPWARVGFKIRHYDKQSEMKTSTSLALAAVAETGSLLIASSQANARGINFLIDNHIVFISTARFFFLLEDAWSALPPQSSSAAIHFITGPSRTADIEQQLFLGAQGPKRLLVVIYET